MRNFVYQFPVIKGHVNSCGAQFVSVVVEELQLLNQGVSQYFQVFSLQRLSNLVRMLDGISGNASIKWIGMEATVDLI